MLKNHLSHILAELPEVLPSDELLIEAEAAVNVYATGSPC